MNSNLAIKLRNGTQKAHTAAENVGFMKCFLKGVVDKACFGRFLGNLYFVYSTLEGEIQRHQNNPLISKFYFPELNRQANLEQDMEYYYGKDWRQKITPSPAAQKFVARIREISATEPILLLGHAYTRYMGDLSGGQMLQKIAQSSLKLDGYTGTSFYNFEQIPDKKTFKDKYRQALDSIPVDDATADKIVAEANSSFAFNMQMAQELEGNLIQSIGQALFNSLTQGYNPGSTELVSH
ncbi:biliverdin-producing heme oxygenase [Calothrix sp. 336/3]|uniref:biliverdin-producing heme oxygenase n=1 Tax=Calothrix sp. 336/3 TaxID=1337936 RepID=UPI0004E2FCA2|nr:heme oxygenase (biliverdin-producing) [Calothrix sp. 336/3]AKG24384.1 heme oxygenase [Calothrix sp. 336/3]